MNAPEIIAVSVIAFILLAAVFYIVKAKRSGKRCIGCPDGGSCGGSCSHCSGCASSAEKSEKTDSDD